MPLDRPLVRSRHFTLGDLAFLVALACLVFAAASSVCRRWPSWDAAFFLAIALGAHVSVVALLWIAPRRWPFVLHLVAYALVGFLFVFQVAMLILIDPWSGTLMGLSVLLTLFHAVSWC